MHLCVWYSHHTQAWRQKGMARSTRDIRSQRRNLRPGLCKRRERVWSSPTLCSAARCWFGQAFDFKFIKAGENDGLLIHHERNNPKFVCCLVWLCAQLRVQHHMHVYQVSELSDSDSEDQLKKALISIRTSTSFSLPVPFHTRVPRTVLQAYSSHM